MPGSRISLSRFKILFTIGMHKGCFEKCTLIQANLFFDCLFFLFVLLIIIMLRSVHELSACFTDYYVWIILMFYRLIFCFTAMHFTDIFEGILLCRCHVWYLFGAEITQRTWI